MPNWSYSFVSVEHDNKITKEEFFDKFSVDGKNVSVPMMMCGDKNIAKNFEWFCRHFKIPTAKNYENSVQIGKLFLQPCYGAGHEAREEAAKIMEPHFQAALANEGYSLTTVVEEINDSFVNTLPTVFTMAFNSKFGHRLTSPHQMKKLMDWYDTNCEFLGTKWEFELEDFEVEDETFTFRTQSAWCAPDNFLQWISKEFNTKVISFTEDEGSIGITHKCGWTDEDEEEFDDEEYENTHWANPDFCYEHRRGLMFVNGAKIKDAIVTSDDEEFEFEKEVEND